MFLFVLKFSLHTMHSVSRYNSAAVVLASSYVNQLPEELLKRIFQSLDFRSRGRLERVCQKWRRISFGSWNLDSVVDLFPLKDVWEPILQRCGTYVKSLSIRVPYKCPEYFSLSMQNASVIRKFCPNLKSLRLTGIIFGSNSATDEISLLFQSLFGDGASVPLEELVLSNWAVQTVDDNLSMHRNNYLEALWISGHPKSLCVDEWSLAFVYLLNLRELTVAFYGTQCDNCDFVCAISDSCLNLRFLMLSHVPIAAKHLRRIVLKLSSLQVLVLFYCWTMGAEDFQELTHFRPKSDGGAVLKLFVDKDKLRLLPPLSPTFVEIFSLPIEDRYVYLSTFIRCFLRNEELSDYWTVRVLKDTILKL